MGNYIFSTNLLLRELYADAQNPDSSHDFGRDILPALVGRTEMFAYDFQTNRIAGDPANQEPYWRDVGTIDAYYEANMDLRAVTPGAEFIQSQMASAHRRLFRRAGEIHLRSGRAARPGAGFDRRRKHHSFRRHGARQRAGTRRARAFRRAGGGFDHFR